ncbi:MAG: translation factor Sua5 [Treponema sp.]|nr:MAG: translation factor Sua5 [Treponema sp.]
MTIQKASPNSADITVENLENGNIVIIPTDTLYGFSGIIPDTEDVIYELKNRPSSKKMIHLIADPYDVYQYTNYNIPPHIFKFWPGAITLIVESKQEEETVAIRCPGDTWLRDVIKELGRPIYSTSVNKSGQPAMKNILEIESVFADKVSLIVSAGNLSNQPSTIVDLRSDDPVILRRGMVEI